MAEKPVKRRLAAILAADVVGYSRLMGEDEAGTLAVLKDCYSQVIDPKIAANSGRVVKRMGDGTLAEFGSVVDAVRCALDIQHHLACRNSEVTKDRKIRLRIGVNLGDVILDGDDIYGDGVNVAARLEALARPGGVCISGTVYDVIGNKLPTRFGYMGEQHVKNIENPVRAYQTPGGQTSPGIGPSTHQQTASTSPSKPSLAVKPFENLSSDPEQDQVADGLSGGIIAALTRVPSLILIGDESPFMQRSKAMTVQELGRVFDARFVLKGSLRKLANRIRVNAELMDVRTGHILWAEEFDRHLGDLAAVFDIQDEITEEIVTALDVKLLGGDAARLVRRAFRNPMALQSYYNGEMLLWNSTSHLEIREAERLLEEAIRLEPTTSVGYATAALAYGAEALSGQSDTPRKTLALAVERAQEAIRLGDVTGYPHLVMAQVYLSKHEFEEASVEVDLAVSARPSCPAAYSLKASVLNYLGRPSEAIEYARYALRVTPVHPPMYPAVLASVYYGSERYEDAVAAAKAAIDLDENLVDPYLVLAAASAALNNGEEAHWAADNVRKLDPTFSLSDFAISQPYRDHAHLDHFLGHLRIAGLK